MRSSRKRSKRRDRRKAKQSEYRRAGKTAMGSRVGHGTSGSPGRPHSLYREQKRKPILLEIAPVREVVAEKHSARATIEEMVKAKYKEIK